MTMAEVWWSRSVHGATAPGRRATGRQPRIFGIALLTVSVLGLGVVGTRVAQSASPQGIASSYPTCATALLARSPTTQRVFTAYGTGGYVIYRLWPRASVYEYGDVHLARHNRSCRLPRIAPVPSPLRPHLQLLDSSDTTAGAVQRRPVTDQLNGSPQWTEIIDKSRPRHAPVPSRQRVLGGGRLVRGAPPAAEPPLGAALGYRPDDAT